MFSIVAVMQSAGRRVVLGVGQRAARYDLRFPRVRPVYTDDAADAPRLARAFRVVGAVVTGEYPAQILGCIRALRALVADAAPIVVVSDLALTEQAMQAGASACAATWLAVQGRFALELRAVKARRRRQPPTLVWAAPRRLH